MKFRGNITLLSDVAPRAHEGVWDKHRYERETIATIDGMAGSAVFQALQMHMKHRLWIRPEPNEGRPDASAQALSERDAPPAGELDRRALDLPGTPEDDVGRPIPGTEPGTGLGSDALVFFTPWNHPAADRWSVRGTAEEALLHEMVHAVRFMWGVTSARRFLPGDRMFSYGYRNSEEFYGITIENMFRSERRRPLRGGHAANEVMGWMPNTAGLDEPTVKLERHWIERFYREIPTLARALEHVAPAVCWYNPFHAYRWNEYEKIPVRVRRPIREPAFVPMERIVIG